jgi:hypothetical protein
MELVDTCGWHTLATGETVFVLGDRVMGAAANRVLYQPETRQVVFAVGGTVDGWHTEVAALCVGNSRLTFAVCVALAGPLLHATGDESGGVHLVGSSSTGKTTALYVAGSVWGSHAFLRRWRATANAIDAQAAQHCDTLLVLDELAQVDSKEAGSIAYSLANGQGKARANRTGTAKPVLNWRLLFLSAGEIGLAQHMAEGGKRTRAGQETRLAEVPATLALDSACSTRCTTRRTHHVRQPTEGRDGPTLRSRRSGVRERLLAERDSVDGTGGDSEANWPATGWRRRGRAGAARGATVRAGGGGWRAGDEVESDRLASGNRDCRRRRRASTHGWRRVAEKATWNRSRYWRRFVRFWNSMAKRDSRHGTPIRTG